MLRIHKSSDISWRKFAFRVNDYVNLTNNVQLKFIASDSLRLGQNLDGGSLVEAAVDDLILYEVASTTTSIDNLKGIKPDLVKITDLLGRVVNVDEMVDKTTLLYIYSDGTIEKIVFTK